MRPFSALLLVVLVAALVLTSCAGTKSQGQAPSSTEQPAITGQPAGFNADDVAFATDMITHHRQAMEMSALVPDRSTDPDLITLASDISAVQGPEFEMTKVLLVQWKENPDTNTGQGGRGEAMKGMVDDATMARLESLSGPEFDTLWLQSMIEHHRGAIEMAQAEIAYGANVDAVGMAKQIVDTQETQIGRMQQKLGGG
jgi:uncharacterized protein (DUF305 family)